MQNTANNPAIRIALFLLISMHVAGLIGLQSSYTRWLFELLVPFNLLTTCGILLYFHEEWKKSFLSFLIIVFLTGYFIELLGVQTKLIFGDYQYETTLGIKLFGVPPLIGINWFVLIYSTGIICEKIRGNMFIKIITGATMMVFIDFFIEPVAVRHHFWSWSAGIIPLKNYIAWFITSMILLLFFYKINFKKKNRIAPVVYFVQLVFFMIYHIVLFYQDIDNLKFELFTLF